MRRNAAGQFTNSWEREAKQRVNFSLTQTALQKLEEQAQQQGISKSELIERLARGVEAALPNQSQSLDPPSLASGPTADRVPDLDQPVPPPPNSVSAELAQLAELEAIYATTPTGLCFLDTQLRYVRINEHLAAINGVSVAEHLGRTPRQVLPELADQIEPLFQQVLDSGEPVLELEITGTNPAQPGVLRSWLASFYPLKRQGEVLGVNAVVQEITERKRLEQELSQVNERLNAVLESITEAFITLDHEWRITFMNHQAMALTQLDPQQVLGKTHWEVWPWTVGQVPERAYRRAIAERIPVNFEFLYEPTQTWYEVHAYPSEFGLGVFFRDTSERVRIETELRQQTEILRQSEQRFRAVQELSIDGFILLTSLRDESGQIVDFVWSYGNPEAARILGRPTEDLTGQRLLSIVPGNRDTVFPIYAQVAETGQSTKFELFYDADGIQDWFRVTVVKLDDGVALSFGNITDSKQAEVLQRQRQQRLNLATSAAGLGVFEWNAAADVVVWENERMYEIFGRTFAEGPYSKAQFLDGILHPDDRPAFEEAMRAADQPQADFYLVCRIRRQDSWRWIEVIGRFEPASGDQPLRLVAVTRDITERKRAEAERERLLQEAETAREQAETANRLKDEFLAVLSHELRSPLNPILGWTKLLRTGKLNADKANEALAVIQRNAELQAQLIEDLLDISRIMRGKLTLQPVPVSLPFVISAAIDTVRLAAEAKQIPIVVHLDSTVQQVMGDAARLQQVVWNLLSNAIKFTPMGGRVEVRLEAVRGWGDAGIRTGGDGEVEESMSRAVQTGSNRPDRSAALPNTAPTTTTPPSTSSSPPLLHPLPSYPLQARLTVADTGKGIHPDFLPYVFDYFRQEDGSTTRRFGGLGLGLAIVRQIVELHGGSVWVESAGEGQGASFTVQLPLVLAGAQSAAVEPAETRPDLSFLKILVVDDDADSRELIAFSLKQAGAQVHSLGSGVEALEWLTSTDLADLPDLMISDIGMPELDGYELLQKVRAEARTQSIPAIALSAYAGEQNQQLALAAGFQQHVAKPADPVELVQLITRLCSANL